MKVLAALLNALAFAELEAAPAAPTVPAAPAVAPADCKAEVAKCVKTYETALSKREAQLTADFERERAQLQGEVAEQTRIVAELREQQRAEQAKTAEQQKRAEQEAQKREELKQQHQAALAKQQKAHSDEKKVWLETANNLSEKVARSSALSMERLAEKDRKLEALQAQFESSEKTVFSVEHLRRGLRNVAVVGRALFMNFRNNVNHIFKADVFELVRLQALVLVNKVQPHAVSLRDSAVDFYQRRIEPNDSVRAIQTAVTGYGLKGRLLLESKMDRIIKSLSGNDAQIASMFPSAFADRLVAFAYLFAVFYLAVEVASAVVSWLFSPITMLFSRSGAARKTAAASEKKNKSTSVKPYKPQAPAAAETTVKHRKV